MFNPTNNDSFVEHTTELQTTTPVFNEPRGDVVSNQPHSIRIRSNDEDGDSEDREFGSRRQIPISTIGWQSTNSSQVIAHHGVDFLRGIDQVYIQQTVELSDMLSSVRSENRYKVIIPHGETLFYAMEQSSESSRIFCGSNRGFVMHLFDHSQQEAFTFRRTYTIGCCSMWCKLQNLEIWMPNDHYVGRVKQEFTMSIPTFLLFNNHNSAIYRIEGPSSFVGPIKEAHFGIYSNDGLTQLGSINHQWDQIRNDYNIAVTFPGRREDPKHKALVMGAAFLLEYMYFMHSKKAGSCCWC